MRESVPFIPGTPAGRRKGRHRLAWWALGLALICGGILRSVWLEDMEWKKDERWTYRMSQEVGRTQPWPSLGMPTSLGFPNPGLSVWIFIAIGRIVHTPTDLVRTVVLLNMVGLIGFAAAVRAYLPFREQEPWLWGLAVQSVSPYAIRMSRKVWPPSILTPLLLLLWISHRHRQARWGAFAWGLVGALIGQVHLSGCFIALGLVTGTVLAERLGGAARSRYWHFWLLGTALGLVSAVPFIQAVLSPSSAPVARPFEHGLIVHIFSCLYELSATATSVLPYSALGLGEEGPEYEIGPVVDGVHLHVGDVMSWFTFLAIASGMMVRLFTSLVAPGFRWTWRIFRRRPRGTNSDADTSINSPTVAGEEGHRTGFYLWSTIAIPGVIFVLTTDVYFYHYYFVLCPFMFVLIAACLLPWRRLLLGLVIAQALMSYSYLSFIHAKGGITRGEYGWSYARQGNR